MKNNKKYGDLLKPIVKWWKIYTKQICVHLQECYHNALVCELDWLFILAYID